MSARTQTWHPLVMKPHGDYAVDLVCLDPEHDWFRTFEEPPTTREVLQAERDHLEAVRETMPAGIYGTSTEGLGPFPRLYAMQIIRGAVVGGDGRPADVQQWWQGAGWTKCSPPRPEYMHFIGPIPEELR